MSESETVRIYLITQTSIRIAIDVSFLILFMIRIHKLDRMASNNFHQKPKLMRTKIFMLLILQALFIMHILFAYFLPSYWMHLYSVYSLVSILQIVNSFLQIYIIRKQHKKRAVKAYSLPTLWILWLIFDLSLIIFVGVQIQNTSILLLVFQAMTFVGLIVIGCFLQQKNSLKDDFIQNVASPLITQNKSMNQKYSQVGHNQNQIYIQFNKEFQISMTAGRLLCEFKFAISYGQQSTILIKKQQQFIRLANQMMQTFPQCNEVILRQRNNQLLTDMKKYGQQMQKVYQTYLIQLTKNEKFLTNYLLDFLQMSVSNRKKLKLSRQRQQTIMRRETVQMQNEQVINQPFFRVQIQNNKIHISNPQILQFFLNKSRSQIQRFHIKLLSQKKIKIQYLSSQPDMNQYIHFIYRVVNNKALWRCFCQWHALGKQLQDKIYCFFDFWNQGFSTINVHIIGYQIAFDKQGSIHNLYLLTITQNNKPDSADGNVILLKQNVTIKKRFNDFVKLDRSIKKFMSCNNIESGSLISLPPKFSPFGTKTSPKSRQIYLDIIPQINHCVKFLQFLEIDLGRFKEELFTVDQEHFRMERISSIIIDQLDGNYT